MDDGTAMPTDERHEFIPSRPPPDAPKSGLPGWVKRNLFYSTPSGLLTIAVAALGLGGTEARAQWFGGRGPLGGRYKVVVKERGHYPGPVVAYGYPAAAYIAPAPVVVSQTQFIRPAPVVARRVYQPPPVVERPRASVLAWMPSTRLPSDCTPSGFTPKSIARRRSL